MMENLPTLDEHAHFDPARTAHELTSSGAVLAMTMSLDEVNKVVDRSDPWIAWGADHLFGLFSVLLNTSVIESL
ncbi:MAG: hypothetical protein ACM3PY_04430 [Omnitrophica WOR_2 bacterium]